MLGRQGDHEISIVVTGHREYARRTADAGLFEHVIFRSIADNMQRLRKALRMRGDLCGINIQHDIGPRRFVKLLSNISTDFSRAADDVVPR